MSEEDTPKLILDLGLSEKEVFLIGRIVSQWGAIEHEIFEQCLLTFYSGEREALGLPKEMNNLSFSKVLKLWKERIMVNKSDQTQMILSQQYEKIVELKDHRNALVHGMWSWNPNQPDIITTTRIKKKEIIATKFKSDDLEHLYTQISQIYFNLKFPGGRDEYYQACASKGVSFSRKGFEMIFGNLDKKGNSE